VPPKTQKPSSGPGLLDTISGGGTIDAGTILAGGFELTQGRHDSEF
jgi:hypothetical protein